LAGVQYEFADAASGGGLKIESKESIKKRGEKSPDFVDACWYAAADLNRLSGHQIGDVLYSDMDDYIPHARDWFYTQTF